MFLSQNHTTEGERKMNWSFPCDKAKYSQEVLVEAPIASFEKNRIIRIKRKTFGSIWGMVWMQYQCMLLVLSKKSFKVSTETGKSRKRNTYRPQKYVYNNIEQKCYKLSFPELEMAKYRGNMATDIFWARGELRSWLFLTLLAFSRWGIFSLALPNHWCKPGSFSWSLSAVQFHVTGKWI